MARFKCVLLRSTRHRFSVFLVDVVLTGFFVTSCSNSKVFLRGVSQLLSVHSKKFVMYLVAFFIALLQDFLDDESTLFMRTEVIE